MKITIDTKNDSKVEIIRAIELLNKLIRNTEATGFGGSVGSQEVSAGFSDNSGVYESGGSASQSKHVDIFKPVESMNSPKQDVLGQGEAEKPTSAFNSMFGSDLGVRSADPNKIESDIGDKEDNIVDDEQDKITITDLERY